MTLGGILVEGEMGFESTMCASAPDILNEETHQMTSMDTNLETGSPHPHAITVLPCMNIEEG